MFNPVKLILKRIVFRSKVEIPADKIRNSQLYKRGKERIADPNQPQKIIWLMRKRNETNVIAFSIRALAQYTDAIIVFDDRSNDGTHEILQSLKTKCKIEAIIQ